MENENKPEENSGTGEELRIEPVEKILAEMEKFAEQKGVGVELADVLAERDTLRRLVGKLAQRIQFARLVDPNPGGEDPLLREAAAVCKREKEGT